MELLQLKYFLAAAHYQHITKAANALQIAQPALSQSIKRLEDELGVSLFDRTGRGIVLNSTGKLLQKRLTPILVSLERLPQELKDASTFSSHTVHLNLLSASNVVTECIIAYRVLHPDVNFQLSQTPDDGLCDLTVSSAMPGEALPATTQVIAEENIFLAVSSSSPYARLNSIDLQDTASESYITLAPSKLLRQIYNRFWEAAGITPHIIFESDYAESVRNLISAGLGIGFWPQYSWEPPSTAAITLLPIRRPLCRRSITLTVNSPGERNPMVADFSSFLVNYVQSQLR